MNIFKIFHILGHWGTIPWDSILPHSGSLRQMDKDNHSAVDIGRENIYSMTMGDKTGKLTVEINVEFPQNSRCRYTISSSYTTPGHFPIGLYIILQRHLLIHIHCFFINNSHKIESAYMTINWGIMKIWYLNTMKVYSAVKKNEILK